MGALGGPEPSTQVSRPTEEYLSQKSNRLRQERANRSNVITHNFSDDQEERE